MNQHNTDFAKRANAVFDRCVADYHLRDHIDAEKHNPYAEGTPESLLYDKCWIDSVQWHLEDIIRDPEIDPKEALALKRRIDVSNQERTDMVEDLDSYFRELYKDVSPLPNAGINTESPAWAIDRLSILALKIWHMREQYERADADRAHKERSLGRLEILEEQRKDLTEAIDTLLGEIARGSKYMKVYRQMKMYNDPETNPVLYGHKNNA